MLIFKLIDKLAKEHSLTLDEYVQLVGNFSFMIFYRKMQKSEKF